jgi:hypothetical protein
MASLPRASILAFGLAACGNAAASTPSTPQTFAQPDALRRALCEGEACSVEQVLPAGSDDHGAPLAVVRVQMARDLYGTGNCKPYRDYLVGVRGGQVVALRHLVESDEPCMEWVQSRWTFENGELLFHHGGGGAPPAQSTDVRPIVTHCRPWPFAIVSEYRGTDQVPTPILPTSGPVFRLTVE